MQLHELLDAMDLGVCTHLLERALTHSSYVNEHPGEGPSNERMEFLGDAVLGMVVSEYLFDKFPGVDEGTLSSMRSSVVRAETLAAAAAEMDLGDQLRLGRGEIASGGRAKESVLADAFEALVAAIHLSCGLKCASRFVRHTLADALGNAPEGASSPDPKSALDRAVKSMEGPPVLRYDVVERDGPDHDPRFTVEVYLDDRFLARGRGRSKRRAEERAAMQALMRLESP